MDDQEILSRAISWMCQRGWREKLAKSKSGQSLYEHTLIELDTFLRLAPVFREVNHLGLSELEFWIVCTSLIVHDAGKETQEWQSYVKVAGAPKVGHILPELSAALVPEICAALSVQDLTAEVHQVIANCAGIHHDRPGRSDASILSAMVSEVPARFVTLANLVKSIDRLCSAESPAQAVATAEKEDSLHRSIRTTSHELIYRGVSTALLHRAARSAFEQSGWTVLLYFSTGTVYMTDRSRSATIPPPTQISQALISELETALKGDLASMMVGSPTGNLLPKPDLVSFSEVWQYLMQASQKIGRQSFVKKKADDRKKVVIQYLKLRQEPTDQLTDTEIDRQSGRISVAQPEMLVFKFFKALTDPDKLPVVGDDGHRLAQQKYEVLFGPGSWMQLQSTSTLMAAKDMHSTVDLYWNLPGDVVGHPASKVEQIDDETRLKLLVDLLSQIADEVFRTIDRPSPRDAFAGAMAQSFIGDVISPAESRDVRAMAQKQLANYRQSKPNAGKELSSALYICPICSRPFNPGSGLKASADFIDNPQTHTNRALSHGGFGYVMICTACYHERVLRQLLMGGTFAEIISLSPRLNLGPVNGSRLTQRVREWADAANKVGNLESGFSMNLTDVAARQIRSHDPFQLEPGELVSIFRFRFTSDHQKKRKKDLLERLKQDFEDLDTLNLACDSSFNDWDEATEALIADTLDQQDCKTIRREVLRTGDAIRLIPETPNLILIPLSREIAGSSDESESNKAIRRLYVSLILSVAFDSCVSIRHNADVAATSLGFGAAWVPAVAAVRSLIGSEWIGVTGARQWLNAIGAAGMLARDAALPPRASLYLALSADPAEKLIRRIEKNGRTVSPLHLDLISRLPGFHAQSNRQGKQ